MFSFTAKIGITKKPLNNCNKPNDNNVEDITNSKLYDKVPIEDF